MSGDEIQRLLTALLDERLEAADRLRLVELLRNDPAARTYYLRYVLTDAMLRLEHSAPIEVGSGQGTADSKSEIRNPKSEIPIPPSAFRPPPSAIAPSIVLDLSPAPHPSFFALNSSVGGFLFSYLMGAVLLGIGLLIGWSWRISYYRPVAQAEKETGPTWRDGTEGLAHNSDLSGFAPGKPRMESRLVACVTAMADCRWIDPATEAAGFDDVALGRKFALASGLIEITYDSGAKVILQGPAVYEVESARGGFLSFGKLTARVERRAEGGGRRAKGEVGSRQWAVGGKSEIRNPKSEISNPQSPIPNPLFSVRTPTAIVTDLGTEFGVEVNRSGASRAYVFEGRVELRPAGCANFPSPSGRGTGAEGTGLAILLCASEAARVELGQGPVATVTRQAGQPGAFVREMPRSPQSVRGPGTRGQSAGPISPLPRGEGPGVRAAYRLTDLGTLGGAVSRAFGVNAAGQVVGGAATATGAVHAFLYSDGAMKDLGTLGGSDSCAYGINSHGQVVGSANTTAGQCRAFLYADGAMKDLGALGGAASVAYGINDAGQVVGVAQDARGVERAFLYARGKMTDIGSLGGGSCASHINARGQVTGYSITSRGVTHAFVYTDSAGIADLGTLGAGHSLAYCVNDAGQVVGRSGVATAGGPSHAFLYTTDSGMKDLGVLEGLNSHAFGINAAGQVVGTVQTASAGFHAFLCSGAAREMIDLNSSFALARGWTLTCARAINDSGQIVGHGTAPDGNVHAFLLTPQPGTE